MTDNPDLVKSVKRALGQEAAARIQSGMIVGLGSGSTSAEFIRALGERHRRGEVKDLRAVATSYQSTLLARECGISLHCLEEFREIDMVVDGADEVDPALNLIKGGGGAHTLEKVAASLARHFLVIADWRKRVENLGSIFPVPLEVIPSASVVVINAVRKLGGKAEVRIASRKAGPVITDLGNFLLDARFPPLANPARLEKQLNCIPGVVENGLFCNMAHEALIGEVGDDGIRIRQMVAGPRNAGDA